MAFKELDARLQAPVQDTQETAQDFSQWYNHTGVIKNRRSVSETRYSKSPRARSPCTPTPSRRSRSPGARHSVVTSSRGTSTGPSLGKYI